MKLLSDILKPQIEKEAVDIRYFYRPMLLETPYQSGINVGATFALDELAKDVVLKFADWIDFLPPLPELSRASGETDHQYRSRIYDYFIDNVYKP